MRKHIVAGPMLVLMVVTGTLYPGLALAADDLSTAKDLTTVIALHGQPCGPVVGVKQQGDNDYLANCQDGNRYRVFINTQGRVMVQKQ